MWNFNSVCETYFTQNFTCLIYFTCISHIFHTFAPGSEMLFWKIRVIPRPEGLWLIGGRWPLYSWPQQHNGWNTGYSEWKNGIPLGIEITSIENGYWAFSWEVSCDLFFALNVKWLFSSRWNVICYVAVSRDFPLLLSVKWQWSLIYREMWFFSHDAKFWWRWWTVSYVKYLKLIPKVF